MSNLNIDALELKFKVKTHNIVVGLPSKVILAVKDLGKVKRDLDIVTNGKGAPVSKEEIAAQEKIAMDAVTEAQETMLRLTEVALEEYTKFLILKAR